MDWPEPVVRVQSLWESGASVVPCRYIKPPPDRPGPASAASSPADIPVVDLADPGAASSASAACRDWGFFQAVGHGVRLELMRRARELWRGFFHLPMAEKQAYANSPATYEGYGSRLGVEKGALLDWGDYFYLHFSPLRLASSEKWPSSPPSLRHGKFRVLTTMLQHHSQCSLFWQGDGGGVRQGADEGERDGGASFVGGAGDGSGEAAGEVRGGGRRGLHEGQLLPEVPAAGAGPRAVAALGPRRDHGPPARRKGRRTPGAPRGRMARRQGPTGRLHRQRRRSSPGVEQWDISER